MDRPQDLVPDRMPVTHAWLITGIPGAGKTTLSPLLAASSR
jgi:ABC-type molybdenum transport system ATPase subunit/photorepair protein PhrA